MYKFSWQKFLWILRVWKNFVKFAKICFRKILKIFREICEIVFAPKFQCLKIFNYFPNLMLGQNRVQNLMISLEYHHFELNVIERNPQDGGSLVVLFMVGWSKTIMCTLLARIWLGLKISFLPSFSRKFLHTKNTFFVRKINWNNWK